MAEADTSLQPVLTPVAKPLSLIPVTLKEAALDSPTFRGTTAHFSEQLESVTHWLESYCKSASRLSNEVTALESLVNTYLTIATPPTQVSEALLDHDYTVLALKRYNEGAREFWGATFKWMKKVESTVVEPIRAFIANDVGGLRVLRRNLEGAQRGYDTAVVRYAAQSRTKENSSLREDAFQLHEARKAYLKASMDYCVQAPQVRSTLDRLLVNLFSMRWKEMKNSRDALANSFGKWSGDIERVRGWSKEMENGERVFRRELQLARKQIEDIAELSVRPSRELEDYSVSTVTAPYIGQTSVTSPKQQPVEEKEEKQGWLFQRTITGKPSRIVWVRRWFYVKHGIFGWLNNNTRSGAVEESEKTGVLLCGIRPAAQEERRFCFEVKTKDSTIVLQAETQAELADWIATFEVSKRKALENPASTDAIAAGSKSVDAAFAISPAVAPEFAAKTGENYEEGGGIERSTTFNVEAGNLQPRGSFDVSGRKTMASGEGESSRDHAARIIQKLDLHRKTTATPQMSGSSSPAGGIASLISASHTVLPMGGVAPPIPSHSADYKAVLSNNLPSSSLSPSTLANPPAPTNLSKTAVVVSGERGLGLGSTSNDSGMPGALMANIWGTANWGHASRVERGEISTPKEQRRRIVSQPPSPIPSQLEFGTSPDEIPSPGTISPGIAPVTQHRKAYSLAIAADSSRGSSSKPPAQDTYPNYYPLALKAQDLQFRMLFPSVPRSDKLVLVFRATWNPNDQQEFPGRVYVTLNDVYFYSNHFGLVLITSLSLDSITEVTAAPGKDCDFLFLHLKPGFSPDGATRLTIRTFLEPLKLLERRLNFLVRNTDAVEQTSLEEAIKSLIKMETQGTSTDESPNLDDWDDLFQDGTTQRRTTDFKTGLRIDGTLYPDPSKSVSRNATKFRLPGQPVVYVPQGMSMPVISKVFDVTAKALFHVLAGDKSAVFQMLNVENGAERLLQSAWTQPDQGHHRRTFQYQVTNGTKRIDVVDYQIIDVLNDHLCYVITDRRTPWSLPASKKFSLVSKIVVTHVAKSQCKLAIYTKVDWRDPPLLGKGLIESQALNDLRLYASSLTSTLDDQISRLGSTSTSNSRKAISVFGQIGLQTSSTSISASDLPPSDPGHRILHHSLSELIFVAAKKTAVHTLVTALGLLFNLLKAIVDVVSVHRVVVVLLVVSAVGNFYWTSRDGWEWWRDRRAEGFMARVGVRPNVVIGRSVWLRDLDGLVGGLGENNNTGVGLVGGDGACAQQFNTLLSQTDPSSYFPTTVSPTSTSSTSPRFTRLQRSRQHIGSYRHDLLVALRVVDRVEKEMLRAEWESWVFGEVGKCKEAGRLLIKSGKEGDVVELKKWWEGYCGSCMESVEGLKGL